MMLNKNKKMLLQSPIPTIKSFCILFINLALCSSTLLLTGCSNMRLAMMGMEDNAKQEEQKNSNDSEITTGKPIGGLLKAGIAPEVLDEIKDELEVDPYLAFYSCTLEAKFASSVGLQQIDDLAKEALKRIDLKKNNFKLNMMGEEYDLEPIRSVSIPQQVRVYTTFLILATRYGFAKCLAYLIKEIEVDINEQDSVGNTALHWAAESLDLATMRTLIEAGGDVTLKNNSDRNCLHILAQIALAHRDKVAYSKKNLQDFMEYIKNTNAKSRAGALVALVESLKLIPRKGENKEQNFVNHPLFEGKILKFILDYADKTDSILAISDPEGLTVSQRLSQEP